MRLPQTLILILIALLLVTPASWAGPHDLVVIQPGGPASTEEAQQQVGRLIAEIAVRAGWPVESARAYYFNDAEKGLAHIQSDKPGFLLTTPGFFLKHRLSLNLTPLNQVLVEGKKEFNYFVVAKKETGCTLESLKGKKLAGAILAEPLFVERIVLNKQLVFGEDVQVLEMRSLSALRRLSSGEVDAVVLDYKEYAAMANLPFADQLQTIFTSQPIPNTGIMTLGKIAADQDIQALGKAVQSFCDSGEGVAICETYGITGFAPAAPDVFADLIKMYQPK